MGVTVFYTNGQVTKMSPEPRCSYYEVRELIDEATSIVSDGVHYDLTDINSICEIAVPNYTYSNGNHHSKDLGVTGFLDYVLRKHAGLLWNENKYDLSMACLRKACQLMLHSTVGWQRSDYYRIVNEYIELGYFKKAREWKAWIDRNTPLLFNQEAGRESIGKERFKNALDSCKSIGTNLIEVTCNSACCEICAKYRNRIYRTSLKNMKYPPFPKDFHFGCGLGLWSFWEGVSEPSFDCKGKSYVSYSNRPFIDDRTPEERQAYQEWLERLEKSQFIEREPDLNHIIYHWFKPIFPNDFPKSVGGFSRMRNANSPKYQKLMQMVKDAGYWVPNSIEDVIAWDEANN